MVNKKVRAVLGHDMTPIVCVGETLEERDAGGTESKVTQQVRRACDGVDAEQAATAVIVATSRSGRSAPAATPSPATPAASSR